MTDKKIQLLYQLQPHVDAELQSLQKSVDSAAEAATHPEAKPENKYDTRGLEASYLAGAQKERVGELKAALQLLKNTRLKAFTESDRIGPTALIELDQDGQLSLCFLMAWGAGYALLWDERPVLTITPQSPLGHALIGKTQGDTALVRTAAGLREYSIVAVY